MVESNRFIFIDLCDEGTQIPRKLAPNKRSILEEKPTLRQQLLSKKFGAAVSMFAASTIVMAYLIVWKCNTADGFNFGSALSYFEAWGEMNLWNCAIFGGADVLEKAAPYMKRKTNASE